MNRSASPDPSTVLCLTATVITCGRAGGLGTLLYRSLRPVARFGATDD